MISAALTVSIHSVHLDNLGWLETTPFSIVHWYINSNEILNNDNTDILPYLGGYKFLSCLGGFKKNMLRKIH